MPERLALDRDDGAATLRPEIQHATLDIIGQAYGRVVSTQAITDEVATW
jgi:hypothetical protein